MGAFGAHALESTLTSKRMDTWETAVFYHTWNTLGIIIIGIFSKIYAITCTRAANGLLLGIIIFSGSLYTLCLTNIGWFGAITPLGGICLIGAWIDFGINLLQTSSK